MTDNVCNGYLWTPRNSFYFYFEDFFSLGLWRPDSLCACDSRVRCVNLSLFLFLFFFILGVTTNHWFCLIHFKLPNLLSQILWVYKLSKLKSLEPKILDSEVWLHVVLGTPQRLSKDNTSF